MEAKELMIGDWVQHPVYGKLRINELGTTFSSFWNEQIVPTRELEPIPITPETLKKNGFKEQPSDYIKWAESYKEWVSEDERITINKLSNSFNKDWSVHIDNEDMQTIGSADIQFVHELQHALKLFGIEKEIKL